MKLATLPARLLPIVILWSLQACSGGGGSDDSNVAQLSLNVTRIDVAAEPGDQAPETRVDVTISNAPPGPLYIVTDYTTRAIHSTYFGFVDDTHAVLLIYFKKPTELPNGTHEDTIQFRVCRDATCDRDIRGSPANLKTSYVVSGGVSATMARDAVATTIDKRDEDVHAEHVRIELDEAPKLIHIETDNTANGVALVEVGAPSLTTLDVNIYFKLGSQLDLGTHHDTITVRLCYENPCVRQFEGSPFTITADLTVGIGVEPGIDVLPIESRVALAHDVVDAEFSRSLNAIVMVGAWPTNALYVYDVATGSERRQALTRRPSAVSVAPDGLTAAVAHDARISVVDLQVAGLPGAPSPILLDVSADIFDLVLDGQGSVHAFPRDFAWEAPHSVEIATNTEREGIGTIYDGAHVRLHPSGTSIYQARFFSGGSTFSRFNVVGGILEQVYASAGDAFEHRVCGDVWFSNDGATIYTACGATFVPVDVPAAGVEYRGTLALSEPQLEYYSYVIRSLSQFGDSSEITLIEGDERNCTPQYTPVGPCYTHLAVYDRDSLARKSLYSFGSLTVDGTPYAQHGLFVFHDSAGGRRFVISRLENAPGPDSEFYLSTLE